MADEESTQTACLDLYRSQLNQVEASLLACSDESSTSDLIQLQADLRELIQLTEESLLNIKKQRLLATLNSLTSQTQSDHSTTSAENSSPTGDALDDEFAEFQKAMALCNVPTSVDSRKMDYVAAEASVCSSRDIDMQLGEDENDSSSDDDDCSEENLDKSDDLCGSKCRVLHSHSWGEMTEHNAMIICQESNLDGQKMVRIVFCNPTHNSMIPCPFYLEGRCRFSDLDCRYSHGEVVSFDKIKAFKDPDFSQVHIGSRCLAKDEDNVWYPGSVVEILSDYRFKVQYDANSAVSTVDVENILPLESSNDSGDESDQSEASVDVNEEENEIKNDVEDLENPVCLWNGGSTTEVLGEWEKYTKGIGSKLMAQMGYIVGQGLGKNGEGRAEPVPIELLPQGKSLDKIMEMKSLASDKDLFNALKKQKRMQKKIDKSAVKNALKLDKKIENRNNMFDFINTKLNNNRSRANSKRYEKDTSIKSTNISLSDLKSKSDKHLNIQLFKTQEEIKKTHLEVTRLQSSLSYRNEKQELVVAKHLGNKLASLNEYIKTLHASKAFLQQELRNRKAHTVLTKF